MIVKTVYVTPTVRKLGFQGLRGLFDAAIEATNRGEPAAEGPITVQHRGERYLVVSIIEIGTDNQCVAILDRKDLSV